MHRVVYNDGEMKVINGMRKKFNNGEVSSKRIMVTRDWIILNEYLGINPESGDLVFFPCYGTESMYVGNIKNYSSALSGVTIKVFIEIVFLGGGNANMLVCDCLENTGSLLARSLREVGSSFKREMRELMAALECSKVNTLRYRGEFLKRIFRDMWVLTLRYPDRYKGKFLTVVANRTAVKDGRSSFGDVIARVLDKELERKKVTKAKEIMEGTELGIPSYEYISRVNDNMYRIKRLLE